jgi:hypothetical protein
MLTESSVMMPKNVDSSHASADLKTLLLWISKPVKSSLNTGSKPHYSRPPTFITRRSLIASSIATGGHSYTPLVV